MRGQLAPYEAHRRLRRHGPVSPRIGPAAVEMRRFAAAADATATQRDDRFRVSQARRRSLAKEPEGHFKRRADLHRLAVLERRLESPLRHCFNRSFIEAVAKATNDPDIHCTATGIDLRITEPLRLRHQPFGPPRSTAVAPCGSQSAERRTSG